MIILIKPRLPFSSLPNIKSWNDFDLTTIVEAIPTAAPAIGPPTILPKILAPLPVRPDVIAPIAPPPINESLFSFRYFCCSLEIIPPRRSPVTSSFSPKSQFWNLSLLDKIPTAIPKPAPAIGPPTNEPKIEEPEKRPTPAPIAPPIVTFFVYEANFSVIFLLTSDLSIPSMDSPKNASFHLLSPPCKLAVKFLNIPLPSSFLSAGPNNFSMIPFLTVSPIVLK